MINNAGTVKIIFINKELTALKFSEIPPNAGDTAAPAITVNNENDKTVAFRRLFFAIIASLVTW